MLVGIRHFFIRHKRRYLVVPEQVFKTCSRMTFATLQPVCLHRVVCHSGVTVRTLHVSYAG